MSNVYHFQNKQSKMEQLTDWIAEQGQWAADYVEHEDSINNYAECLYHGGAEVYLGELENDVAELVKDNEELALEHCEPELIRGYHRCDNELNSIGIGEIETELTGIMVDDIECFFTHLCKGLTPDEIQSAGDKTDYCYKDGYLYDDFSYWRVGLILNVDEFKLALKE